MRVEKYQDGCWRIEVNGTPYIETLNPQLMCHFTTTLRIEGQHVKTRQKILLFCPCF